MCELYKKPIQTEDGLRFEIIKNLQCYISEVLQLVFRISQKALLKYKHIHEQSSVPASMTPPSSFDDVLACRLLAQQVVLQVLDNAAASFEISKVCRSIGRANTPNYEVCPKQV